MAGINCGKLDLTKLPQDEIITINKQTWLKADVDEKIYIVDNKPHVVVKFSDTCVATVCDDQNKLNKPLANLAGAREANSQSPPSENCDPQSLNCSQNQTRSLSETITNNDPNVTEAQKGVDANSINIYSWYGAAVKPASAVIPMRSNIKTYGPYASSNFGSSCGGTQVEVNTDLAPWVFGSTSTMNTAGASIVESTAIGLVKAETGSITIPGLPLSSFTGLGLAINGSGPTLSAINFSYGSSGISTSYEFRTYTPKFGGLNRHFIDRIKNISKNRTEQLRFLRSNQITANKISRKLKNIANPPRDNKAGGGTLQRVMVGEIYNWESVNDKFSQCTIVGIDTLRKSVGEMTYDYEKKAYISLDAIYGPISKYGDGSLPRYTSFETGCHVASPDLPNPPYAVDPNPGSEDSDPFQNGLDQYNLAIDQTHMDPLTNPFDEDGHHHSGAGIGHVIDLVGRESKIPEEGMITNFYDLDDENRYSEDYRFLGMRGPIVLHSWGYDTQGKPIPNEADTEEDTKTGQFKNTDLKDKFLGDWLGKPATWPVAPIDFRFDRKRGVWVTPPGYKVVVAILDEKLNKYGVAKASLINEDKENGLEFGSKLYDKEGQEVKATDEKNTEAKIQVVDRIGLSYASGTRMYCYYDTFDCKYIVIEAARKTSTRFKLIDLCDSSPVEPDYGDDWTKYAGYGDKFPNNHILGIRIDCDGEPIDIKGNPINHNDIINPEKRKDIFINLYDTCGVFGSAYAHYNSNGGQQSFNKWRDDAATGFALLCDPMSENSCALGEMSTQCSTVDPEYDSYDIVFLDQYARFVECELTQKLYMSKDDVEIQFPNDEFKNKTPEGNAAATIQQYYGNPGNGISPKFYNDSLEEIEFRVFDPFSEYPKHLNPFAQLDYGEKVLAVFDEKRKKYIIYQSLRMDEKVIKFALVDNKDIGDRISRAVLVDIEGYPIDISGERLTDANFLNNFITVFDPFASHGYSEPFPKYHNWGTTGFGPALGSDNFDEHLFGITLKAGDWNAPNLPGEEATDQWTGGPFIGYAIHKKMTTGVSSELQEYEFDNEIIFLESFARTIVGKIASTNAIIDSTYYLGVLRHDNGVTGGFIDGRIPFTRDGINQDQRANIRVKFPLDQHYAGKYITGDFFEGEKYKEGDVYNNVDGCNFVAQLDPVSSKVNDGGIEKLFYVIKEVENIANRGKSAILYKDLCDQLNSGSITEDTDEEKILSQYMDGFIWDKENSPEKYKKITINNRYDWISKALIMSYKDSETQHIRTSLEGYDNGTIFYRIDYAGTIAQVGEGSVPPSLAGIFGKPNAPIVKDDKKIGKFHNTKFYHGINPLHINTLKDDNDAQPVVQVTNPWMTYDGSRISMLWDETVSSKIEDAQYKVIYAREAPIIITGQATKDFRPEDNEVSVMVSADALSSCPGVFQEPVISIIQKATNPMGYGAKTGDLVVLQRVFLDLVIENNANYKYIVIGTGKQPDACSGS